MKSVFIILALFAAHGTAFATDPNSDLKVFLGNFRTINCSLSNARELNIKQVEDGLEIAFVDAAKTQILLFLENHVGHREHSQFVVYRNAYEIRNDLIVTPPSGGMDTLSVKSLKRSATGNRLRLSVEEKGGPREECVFYRNR
jgi:hypothetical protein